MGKRVPFEEKQEEWVLLEGLGIFLPCWGENLALIMVSIAAKPKKTPEAKEAGVL